MHFENVHLGDHEFDAHRIGLDHLGQRAGFEVDQIAGADRRKADPAVEGGADPGVFQILVRGLEPGLTAAHVRLGAELVGFGVLERTFAGGVPLQQCLLAVVLLDGIGQIGLRLGQFGFGGLDLRPVQHRFDFIEELIFFDLLPLLEIPVDQIAFDPRDQIHLIVGFGDPDGGNRFGDRRFGRRNHFDLRRRGRGRSLFFTSGQQQSRGTRNQEHSNHIHSFPIRKTAEIFYKIPFKRIFCKPGVSGG